MITTAAPLAQPAAAPAVHPLQAVATELEQLTHRQLQELSGSRRKASKGRLVALVVAG